MSAKLVRGLIDGSLSTLGIVIGASSASVSIIVAAAVGGAIANGFSNALSAFSAAGAEEHEALRDAERAMVTHSFRGTDIERSISRRTLTAGLMDALGSVAGGALPVIPFLVLPKGPATVSAVIAVMIATGAVGAYTGKLARRNLVISAVKMMVLASVIAAVVFAVQAVISPEA